MKEKRFSIEQWLTYLSYAPCVICDSFHGVVFSIIMHRPFIVLANERRRNARLSSLLEMLGLSDRLLDYKSGTVKIPDIDWEEIDSRLHVLRKKSNMFISEALK